MIGGFIFRNGLHNPFSSLFLFSLFYRLQQESLASITSMILLHYDNPPSKILFLFLLVMTLAIMPLQAFHMQVPFYLDHHNVAERENTLKLKTIYHHASANGPIPKLFRKLDLDTMATVNKEKEETYTIKSKLGHIDRPYVLGREELLRRIDDKDEDLTRWGTINNYQPYTTTMESTIGVLPDVRDRPSILSLAMMTNNAYLDINVNNTEWYDLGAPWHLVKV